jgi:hypothetical protein
MSNFLRLPTDKDKGHVARGFARTQTHGDVATLRRQTTQIDEYGIGSVLAERSQHGLAKGVVGDIVAAVLEPVRPLLGL